MTRDDVSQAIFGSFDGVVSVIGVMVALLARPTPIIVEAAVGLAAASAVGVAVVLVAVISLASARARAQVTSSRAYMETFGVLFLAAGVTAVVSWLTGAA